MPPRALGEEGEREEGGEGERGEGWAVWEKGDGSSGGRELQNLREVHKTREGGWRGGAHTRGRDGRSTHKLEKETRSTQEKEEGG